MSTGPDSGSEPSTEKEPHQTVEWFVDSQLTVTGGEETIELEELWKFYGPRSNGVPREEFKWHLIQALPDTVARERNTFHGVKLSSLVGQEEA